MKATADATPRGRKRPSGPTIACPPAGSREKKGKRKRTDDDQEVEAVPSTVVVERAHRGEEEEVASEDNEVEAAEDTSKALIGEGDVTPGGQMATDNSEEEEVDEVVAAKPSKCKKKETPINKRKSTSQKTDIGPRVMKNMEKQFREECGTSAEEQEEPKPKKPKRKTKNHPKKHPKKVPEGKEIDVKIFQEELIEFRERVKPMYI